MNINTIYNETELAIFCRQSGFSFGEFHQSQDGTLCAIDNASGKIFIGKDLLKSNVHDFTSIIAVELAGDNLHLTFSDSREAAFVAQPAEAESIASEIRSCIPDSGPSAAPPDEETEAEVPSENNIVLADTYSILVNTGRSEAIGYLVSETGMSVKDAAEYVDRFGKPDDPEAGNPGESIEGLNYDPDVPMSQGAILSTVKALKPGDRIHVEYKPLIGKLRVHDVEYRGLNIYLASSKYFSLQVTADDFKSLMEEVSEQLFDHIEICTSPVDESYLESLFPLKRLIFLKKL